MKLDKKIKKLNKNKNGIKKSTYMIMKTKMNRLFLNRDG